MLSNSFPLVAEGVIGRASLIGVVLCLVTAFLNRYSRLKSKAVSHIGGPKPWPVIGNAFDFMKLLKNTDLELALMTKRFGNLCMLWLGPQPILFASKLQDMKELFDKNGAIFSDRPKQNIFFRTMWKQFLPLQRLGDDFRILRRVYTDILGPKQSRSIRKYQEFESRMMLRDLYYSPDKFLIHTERFAMSVIFSAVYGVRVGRLDYPVMVELFSAWASVFQYFQPGSLIVDYLPFLERLPESFQPWLRLAKEVTARENAVHNGFLNVLKKQIEAGVESSCFGIDVMKLKEKHGYDDELTLNILKGIILVGSETTSTMMQSILKVLAMYPKAQRNAQAELDRVVGPSRLPTWEDRQNLPYLRALLKECHRWAPLFVLGVPHQCTEEFHYKGYTIPNRTTIMPNVDALMRDPDRYEDPDTFCPERFLGDDLDAFSSAKQTDFRKRDHIKYGWGRRLCQGIHVAEDSLYMEVACILWSYNITTHPDEPPLDLRAKDDGFVKKPKPFRVQILPRSKEAVQILLQSAKDARTDILDADTVELVY